MGAFHEQLCIATRWWCHSLLNSRLAHHATSILGPHDGIPTSATHRGTFGGLADTLAAAIARGAAQTTGILAGCQLGFLAPPAGTRAGYLAVLAHVARRRS